VVRPFLCGGHLGGGGLLLRLLLAPCLATGAQHPSDIGDEEEQREDKHDDSEQHPDPRVLRVDGRQTLGRQRLDSGEVGLRK